MTSSKHQPSEEELVEILKGASNPYTIGDIVYRAVPDGITANSVSEAQQHVSVSVVRRLLSRMVVGGTVMQKSGSWWQGHGVSWYDLRPDGMYFALTPQGEQWLQGAADRAEAGQAKKDEAKAAEAAVAALITRHQDEYLRLFQAARDGEDLQEQSTSRPVDGRPTLPSLPPSSPPLTDYEIMAVRGRIQVGDRYLCVENPQSPDWTSTVIDAHLMRGVLASYIRDGYVLTGTDTDLYAAPGEEERPHDQEVRYIRMDLLTFTNAAPPQPACEDEPEEASLDELMNITFHGLDELVTADVRLTHQLYIGEHIASGPLRGRVTDITQRLGDPGPPLLDVTLYTDERDDLTAQSAAEELQHTPGVTNVRTGDACVKECCPRSAARGPYVFPHGYTDPMALEPGTRVHHPEHGPVTVLSHPTASRNETGVFAAADVRQHSSNAEFIAVWPIDPAEKAIGDDDGTTYVLQKLEGIDTSRSPLNTMTWSRVDLMDSKTARQSIGLDRLDKQAIVTSPRPGEYWVAPRLVGETVPDTFRYIRTDLLQEG